MAHPIAPAGTAKPEPADFGGPRLVPRLSKPERPTGLVTSKKWVVPPRPKPGRKPGSKEGAKKRAVAAGAGGENGSGDSFTALREQLEKSRKENDELRNLVDEFRSTSRSGSPVSNVPTVSVSKSGIVEGTVEPRQEEVWDGVRLLNQSNDAPLEASSDCGFCDREGGCVCEDLGLKAGSSRTHVHEQDVITEKLESQRHNHSHNRTHNYGPHHDHSGNHDHNEHSAQAHVDVHNNVHTHSQINGHASRNGLLPGETDLNTLENGSGSRSLQSAVRHTHHPSALAQFDHFSPVKAVPLKRSPRRVGNNGTTNPIVKKFKRLGEPAQITLTTGTEIPANSKLVSETSEGTSPFEVGLSNTGFNAVEEADAKTSAHANPCGFCSDESPCLCADEREGRTTTPTTTSTTSSSNGAISSESRGSFSMSPKGTRHFNNSTTVSSPSSVSLPPVSSVTSRPPPYQQNVPSSSNPSLITPTGISTNPGSCTQCLSDPMSTLFCTSLSNVSAGSEVPPEKLGMTVTCSQAYQVLSRHQKFPTYDLGAIVSTLISHDGKVGVQSITQALRKLDT
ncbi:Myosin-Vb [Sugiyamaella lignohabitans]|uniref:Myosin-Vb n=1 Tax=Sugiyamaella lignohabitans TaxID=796027 RepID=A0A161HG86_9ASCO|nr:Myosin-Vb [Sugiyamaella lignohabitans]ANB14710.1 Myosin-Vb [Sugiyamaella lignohabitans]